MIQVSDVIPEQVKERAIKEPVVSVADLSALTTAGMAALVGFEVLDPIASGIILAFAAVSIPIIGRWLRLKVEVVDE